MTDIEPVATYLNSPYFEITYKEEETNILWIGD